MTDSQRTTTKDTKTADSTIKTIKLWLNAFIPRDIPDQTKIVPGDGEHGGKTMLPSPPPIAEYFLTDQRFFSSDIHASSRMHSEIEIDVTTGNILYEFHRCTESTRVDPKDGSQLCHESADTSGMKFHNFLISEGKDIFQFDVKGSTKNACFKVVNLQISPNLDYEGTITIALKDNRRKAGISFEGMVEPYPAFEMYVSVNDGDPQVVFQVDIEPGADVTTLAGPPQRKLKEAVEVGVK